MFCLLGTELGNKPELRVEKVRLEIIGLSASHSQSGSFALILGEELGNRRLPIIIGMFEAQAIAVEMEKIQSNRPMTHDLFKSFAQHFDVTLKEIVISNLREGVFYARIVCNFKDGSNPVEMDARPSDAIAIGLRFNVPIYAYESVLQEAGIVLSDSEEEDDISSATPEEVSGESAGKPYGRAISSLSDEELEKMIEEAIEAEDYEKAAKIRDELNRRGNV